MGATIARSEVSETIAVEESESLAEFPVVDPDQLAEQYWEMYTRRDEVERVHPQAG